MDEGWEAQRAAFRAALDEHRRAFSAQLAQARARMQAAVAEFERDRIVRCRESEIARDEARAWMNALRRGETPPGRRGRRRPRGGHPLPVDPAPKPRPRVGGAEAPID